MPYCYIFCPGTGAALKICQLCNDWYIISAHTLYRTAMSRPLEFDRDTALKAAMQLFWRKGYSATSMAELLEVMGIGRSSFYAAFTDKRSLFIETLQLFGERTRLILVQARAERGPAAAIAEFFDYTLLQVPMRRARRGCMMVNTILELADVDDELGDLATTHLKQVEREFEDCFAAAQAAGELPADRSPAQLAGCLMLVNQGLRVASRKRVSRRELAGTLDTALSLLQLPAVANTI